MKRAELLRSLKDVEAAIGDWSGVAALQAVFFDEHEVQAYDDSLALTAACALPLYGGVDGRALTAWVSSCSAADVSVGVEDEQAVFKCGRSKLTLPLVSHGMRVFDEPREQGLGMWPAPYALVEVLRRTAPAMGLDNVHPWRVGVTLLISDRQVTGYASNDAVVTRAVERTDFAPDEDATLVLPPSFVLWVVREGGKRGIAAFEWGRGWVMAHLDNGTRMFAKTGLDVRLSTFLSVTSGIDESVGHEFDVPEEFGPAMVRAAKMAPAFGAPSVMLRAKTSVLVITSGSTSSEAVDEIECKCGKGVLKIDPQYAVPALPYAKRMALTRGALVLSNDNGATYISLKA